MTKFKSMIHYFSILEIILWCTSVMLITVSFCMFDKENYLIFCAKGNPFGQVLMIVFSLMYGIISFTFAYYGEMITYAGMTMPMAVFALISWLRNPYKGNKSEVKVNSISKRESLFMWLLTIAVTIAFYFILKYFGTSNLIPSTFSVVVCCVAFLANDIYGFISWRKMKKRQEENK